MYDAAEIGPMQVADGVRQDPAAVLHPKNLVANVQDEHVEALPERSEDGVCNQRSEETACDGLRCSVITKRHPGPCDHYHRRR